MARSPENSEQRGGLASSDQLNIVDTFSPWYIRTTTYGDEARRVGDGIEVFYTVLPEQCDPRIRQMLRGQFGSRTTEDGTETTNRYPVQDEHVYGHINPVPLFPGWQGEQSVIEAAQQDEDYWVDSVGLIRFSRPIFPENEVVAAARITEKRGNSLLIEGQTAKEGETMFHSQVNDMVLSPVGGRHPEGVLLHGQLLEHQAQAAGAAHLLQRGMPQEGQILIYIGISDGIYQHTYAEPNDILTSTATHVKKDQRTTTYHVVTEKNGAEMARGNIRIGFVPLKDVRLLYDQQMAA